MRRRWVWIVVAPVLLGVAAMIVMLVSGLSKAFSFGSYDRREVQANIAIVITWGSFGLAGLLWLASKALAHRKGDSESSPTLREAANVSLAIFFGGLLALAQARGIRGMEVFALSIFLLWTAMNGLDGSRDRPARRWLRSLAISALSLAVFAAIRFSSL